MNEYKTHNCIFCQTYSFKYVRIYIKKVCYILIENSITVDYWATISIKRNYYVLILRIYIYKNFHLL